MVKEMIASDLKNETISVINPQDGSLIKKIKSASAADAEMAIKEAEEGFLISSRLPVHQRISILQKAAQYILDNSEEYAKILALESSKTIKEARKEVARCIETIKISAEEARRITGETLSFDQMEGGENRVGYFQRFPMGIVLAITPFNDPLNLVAHKVGPAIAAGNAIIVKPATVTPLSALKLAEAFDHAGLPKKILTVLPGKASEIGDVLVENSKIRMISFTGGLEAGKEIMRKAGLKKFSMELGSNSPVIILKDANVDTTVESVVSGAFWAAGQNCIGVQRVFIEEDVYDRYKSKLIERTCLYNLGDKLNEKTDMGPLITENEAIRVEKIVNELVNQGSTVLCGGHREGAFYEPTILENVPIDSDLAKEEIFGPVLLLFKVKDLQEAIEYSNDVDYGLQAGIFTDNVNHAFVAIKDLNVGGIMVNDSSDYRIDAMPFGGVKGSGIGREGIKFAIEEMTEPKVICFNLQ
ncbi:aldehyde dehydrogenase family protein [Lysinibacillus sp. 54212]|uniref:aldehyde dehydrogenase family protein n=1 Tax=Lysinibacillus sp. 54212 TaxID=3119829 RepID=UPI002FCB59C0